MLNTPIAFPDPRQYPSRKPDNWLLQQAQAVVDAVDETQRAALGQQLTQTMDGYLQRRELLQLSVALAMASSKTMHEVLWQALRTTVEQPQQARVQLFALPLVLIGGAQPARTLPPVLTDINTLRDLLARHLPDVGDSFWLSDALVHPDALAKIGPDVLYTLSQEPNVARQALSALPGSPTGIDGETVALRYLVGTIDPQPLPEQIAGWGMPALEWLTQALHTDGVTLFPLLGAPQPLLQAQIIGLRMLNEAALDMFASRQIRALRQAGRTVNAVMSAHENHDVRFSFSATEDPESCRGHVWALSQHDSIDHICEHFARLMADCQVKNVQFLQAVAPDQTNGITLFFHAKNLSASDASNSVPTDDSDA